MPHTETIVVVCTITFTG